MWSLPSTWNSQGLKYPFAPKRWDCTTLFVFSVAELWLPHSCTVLILCAGDKQKIRKRQAESCPQRYTHAVYWNDKAAAVWCVLCHREELEHLGWDLSSTELLDPCVSQSLSCNVSTDTGPGLTCYRASVISMFFYAAVVFACFITAHFWRHKLNWQMCCPDGINKAEPGIYWYGCVSWRLYVFHSLCWRCCAGRNL